MHQAAHTFVAEQVAAHGPFASVVEIGSRDINGSVRGLFPHSSYVGLDLYGGPGVDWIGDSREFRPERPVDAVVCCEVLEHAEDWPGVVHAAVGWLQPGGLLIVTCAGPGRREHSGIDGGRRLQPGEYYANVSAAALRGVLARDGLDVLVCREQARDTQALARA